MGRMLGFYSSLPKTVPGFYLKGYTEALSYLRGVRVIPSEDFLISVPNEFRYFFDFKDPRSGEELTYPAYYVPIKVDRNHYGFLIKSPGVKATPGESWWSGFKVANLEALYDPRPYVVLVEGIKDAFMFLRADLPVVSLLTAGPTLSFLRECKCLGKTIYFAGDNDEAGLNNFDSSSPTSLISRCSELGIPLVGCLPQSQKDWGAGFDGIGNDCMRQLFNEFLVVYHNIIRGEE